MEHIQVLKPEGVWLTGITFLTEKDDKEQTGASTQQSQAVKKTASKGQDAKEKKETKIVISGKSFNNIVLAEFMANLRSTQFEDIDKGDLRTRLFFDMINLNFSKLMIINKDKKDLINNINAFEMIVTFKERKNQKSELNKRIGLLRSNSRFTSKR